MILKFTDLYGLIEKKKYLGLMVVQSLCDSRAASTDGQTSFLGTFGVFVQCEVTQTHFFGNSSGSVTFENGGHDLWTCSFFVWRVGRTH